MIFPLKPAVNCNDFPLPCLMKPEGIPIHIPLLFHYYPITIHIKHYEAIIKPYFPLFFDQMSGDAIVDVTTGVLERFLPERLVSIGCV